MIPFTHPAQKIDQVPGGHREQGHGVVLHDSGEEPTTFRSGSSQVTWGVNEMAQIKIPNSRKFKKNCDHRTGILHFVRDP